MQKFVRWASTSTIGGVMRVDGVADREQLLPDRIVRIDWPRKVHYANVHSVGRKDPQFVQMFARLEGQRPAGR